jgi:uncharacterized membrane protein SpoIIM required for sporulation
MTPESWKPEFLKPEPFKAELKSARFRREREDDWRRLEGLLKRLETQPVSKLSDEDLIALPVLYRATLSALSVARETTLDKALLDYLEGLCTRAYFVVYGARPRLTRRLARFFAVDWPAAARALWRETALAALLFALGAGIACWLYGRDPDWFYAFIPGGMAEGRDPSATTEALRKVLYDGGPRNFLAIFATFLFTHNAQIAIFAFALGFAFGVPTAFLIVTNGCSLGAMVALYAAHGLGLELGGWLAIHGVTEILATLLAGAAGFHIGWTLAFPGAKSRPEALAAAGRRAATLMAGVVLMLAVAGALEGLGRQLITNDLARYGVALTSAAAWGYYLYVPRLRRGARAPQ